MERIYLTPCGMRRLRERIDAARAAYKAVCDDNPAALESGDSSGWHDNFAFEENQRQMHQLARRVQELEGMLGRVTLVAPLQVAPDRVVLGAAVTWRDVHDDDARTVWIAGYEDGDPAHGRLSYDSPLGRQILGATVGETRSIVVAGRRREVEIVGLGPTPVAP
jgi:transcription elongation GreA/GreB family factor